MTDWRILVVDDDKGMRSSLVDLIEASGSTAKALARASEVERWLPQFRPDVILSDVRMPGMTGLELLASLDDPDTPPVVLISAHGDIPTAVEAMKNGAYSFVEKPYEPRRLLSILSHAAEQFRMRATNARLRARLLHLSGLDRVLLGQTPDIIRIRDTVSDLADSPASVLIQGETGSGKELVARALHDLGPHGDGPFIAVNAAQLTPDMVLTVARSADGGTLFLDEIAACPPDSQSVCLRLIDTREILEHDAAAPTPLNMRVVAATNEDVTHAVQQGRLRQDLLYRLNTGMVHLPPLRDRRDDIVLLATHFLTEIAHTYEVAPPPITQDDLAALIAHTWPGNVRELRNAAERRVLMARRGGGSMAEAIAPADTPNDVPATLREAVAVFEREMISKAIQTHQGRMDAIAEALGIGRRTLNEKIVKLGLDKDALL